MQSDLHARGIKPQSPGLRENFQQVGMALPGGTGCESINECFLLHGTRPDSVLDIMNEERPPGTEVGITFGWRRMGVWGTLPSPAVSGVTVTVSGDPLTHRLAKNPTHSQNDATMDRHVP